MAITAGSSLARINSSDAITPQPLNTRATITSLPIGHTPKRITNRASKPQLITMQRNTDQTPSEAHVKGPSPPTPPMSSPESSSPPPGLPVQQCERNSASPDLIPQEVLQGISKIALVKNFNRRLADDEIKERRQIRDSTANAKDHQDVHYKASSTSGIPNKGSTSPVRINESIGAGSSVLKPEVFEIIPQAREKKSFGKPSDLYELEEYQRRIEQENCERKLLLAQAVQERERRTAAEVHRLGRIKAELARLDLILSSDVAILRKEIETASIDFNKAEKNYVRIEKEFIEAKMILHQKLDRKEKLTEHLCFIIEENEVRKAKKLEQLMDELNEKATPRYDDYEMVSAFEQDGDVCTSCGGSADETDGFDNDGDHLEGAAKASSAFEEFKEVKTD
ncbi:RAB6-interacting golgin-like isoform X2 [Varroa destructor]|uniref:RAB6-interacting golgin n=1 Tax=Varroa destructor TaxID=109461 RepID=A0A7M7JTF9_VARDE|nr:RAB6-interacting golgin-like isoform X2 [Varroa destructor]